MESYDSRLFTVTIIAEYLDLISWQEFYGAGVKPLVVTKTVAAFHLSSVVTGFEGDFPLFFTHKPRPFALVGNGTTIFNTRALDR